MTSVPITHREGSFRLLELDNVSTHFATDRGTLRAVDQVSLALDAGATLGLVGESGCGKSVLSRSIMHLLPPGTIAEGGQVLFKGRDLRSLDRAELREIWGAEIAMVFQDAMTSLNPVRQIGDQIADTLRVHVNMSRSNARSVAVELLRSIGIPDAAARLKHYPHQFSGGMRQRIMIAIAVACGPSLLIADEPTTALDVTVQKQILDLIGEQQRASAMAMVLVSHDLAVVRGRTDDTMVMYAGEIVETGPTIAMLDAPRHPYTWALLNCVPRLQNRTHTRLQVIPGRPADPSKVIVGCRFAPRCVLAQSKCLEDAPDLQLDPITGAHHRCFFPVGTPMGDEALARNRAAGITATGMHVTAVSFQTVA